MSDQNNPCTDACNHAVVFWIGAIVGMLIERFLL